LEFLKSTIASLFVAVNPNACLPLAGVKSAKGGLMLMTPNKIGG
jgi:hypothetical protein